MKFLSSLLVFLLVASGSAVAASKKFVDDDSGIFFPPDVAAVVKTVQSFPAFWWNFFVLEFENEADALQQAKRVCTSLQERTDLFERVECGDDLSRYRPLAEAWAADIVLREPAPDAATLRRRFNEAASRAALPLPRAILEILRVDPFGSHKELLAHAQSRLHMPLPRVEGFFLDAKEKRIVIPLLPRFSPAESTRLADLGKQYPAWALAGTHGATLENRTRVMSDVERVSWVGTFLLLLLAFVVWLRGQWRLWLLFPPVFLGAALAAATVRLIFGSVHGLTLAFGVGIIGLTIDYGLHLAFATDPRRVWRSNLAGFFTTMVCLLVLLFSKVPLMRQLMAFSALGFLYAYLCLYLAQRLFPSAFVARPLALRLRTSKARLAAVALCFLGAIAGLAFVRPKFDLRQFNYQSARTARLTDWLFTRTTKTQPLFEIQDSLEKAVDIGRSRSTWAKDQGIDVESPSDYVGDEASRSRNLASWTERLCQEKPFAESLPKAQQVLFAPFLSNLSCDRIASRALAVADAPYLRHLHSGSRWLVLWLPTTDAATASVTRAFPDARSLFAVISEFPKRLVGELYWMAPLSLLLVFLLLSVHFQSAWLAVLGLLPFVAGVGAIAWESILLSDPPSFITFVGVVMMLGLSVDYAIFAIDFLRHHKAGLEAGPEEAGAATALSLSAVTTIAGFLPLIFCQHRVLAHLGWALTMGTIGTVVCAAWGIPALRRWIGGVR